MTAFPVVQLTDVSESITYGFTASADFSRIGPKFLRITDIQNGTVDWSTVPFCKCTTEEVDKYKLRPGDIVFARTGATTGKSFMIRDCPDNAVFASYLIRVRSGALVLPEYLAHFFRSSLYWSQIGASARGAAQVGVNASSLSAIRLPVPPLPEQRRIAAILDQADALRAKRRESLNKLNGLTQAMFLELFGDPFANTNRWPTIALPYFFSFRTGKLDSNAAVPNGDYPFFTCSKEDFRIDRYAFDCEALLLSGNNATADYSVKYYKGKFNAYQRTYVVTLKDASNSYAYARVALESKLGELKRFSKGTNTKYLTMGLLETLKIQVPPVAVQKEFEAKLASVEELKKSKRASLAKMDELFACLQHRAFRGEL